MPAVLSAANEEAVRLFLEGRISFGGITRRIEKAMERHDRIECPDFDEILEVDRWARQVAGMESGNDGG